MTPTEATFSKTTTSESYVDVAFMVANSVITGLKNGSSAVNVNNYTIGENGTAVTIKKEYLASLTVGDKTFTIVTDDTSDNIAVAITVGE